MKRLFVLFVLLTCVLLAQSSSSQIRDEHGYVRHILMTLASPDYGSTFTKEHEQFLSVQFNMNEAEVALVHDFATQLKSLLATLRQQTTAGQTGGQILTVAGMQDVGTMQTTRDQLIDRLIARMYSELRPNTVATIRSASTVLRQISGKGWE